MSLERDNLEKKLAEVLAWERRKRWEAALIAALCAALAGAIGIAPLNVLLPSEAFRWLMPAGLLGVLLPAFLYRHRWVRRDAARAMARLDESLGLQERAVTAWELSERGELHGPAQLVFKQAHDRLQRVDVRRVLPRRWRWPSYFALPLLIVWFTLLWLDFDRWNWSDAHTSRPQTLAQKARQFSRDLQEKAKSEGLRKTLKLGQEVERAAQNSIDNKRADESFKKELAGVAKKFNDQANAETDRSFFSGESQQSLRDLKTELEAARDFAGVGDLPKDSEELGKRWMERLAALPQLKRQLGEAEQKGQRPGPGQFKSFLDGLDQRVTGELDRRALIDAEKYLQQMMRQGRGEQGENYARSSGQGDEEALADGSKEKNHNNLPGKEPGVKSEETRGLPEFRAAASTRVKGALGEGESSALYFKGKPTPGKTAVPQEEIVASYRRQAEHELNSERVPAALKETIKNYFLSLGGSESGR